MTLRFLSWVATRRGWTPYILPSGRREWSWRGLLVVTPNSTHAPHWGYGADPDGLYERAGSEEAALFFALMQRSHWRVTE